MAYAFEDRTLADAIGILTFRGSDASFSELEHAAMAKVLAARTLATAALGEELPDRTDLNTLRGCLPDSGIWRVPTMLSRALLAVTVGATVSRYVPSGSETAAHTIDLDRIASSLGHSIVSPDLLPAVAVPQMATVYPVAIEDDRTFVWDDGRFRFNKTAEPSTRLKLANLLLLARGSELSYPELAAQFDTVMDGNRSEHVVMGHLMYAMTDGTSFIMPSHRGQRQAVDPSAVFVDMRGM